MPRPAAPHRRLLTAVAAGLLVCGTAACGGGDEPAVPEFTGASPGPSTSGPSTSGPSTSGPSTSDPGPSPTGGGDPTATTGTSDVVLGEVSAVPADATPVVDAWLAYWQVLFTAARAAEVDPDALGTVARDEGRARVQRYVGDLQAAGHRLGGGGFVVAVSGVTVDGQTAVLTGCAQDSSYDVDAAGTAQEPPPGPTGLRGTLAQQGGQWVVSDVENDDALCT